MRAIAIAVILLSLSCDRVAAPTAAELEIGGIRVRLDVAISSTRVGADSPATIRARLTNRGETAVRVQFPGSCQLMPYVSDANAVVVLPIEREWGCYAVVTYIDLAPGATEVQEYVWSGRNALDSRSWYSDPLRPGIYHVFAQAHTVHGSLRTGAIRVRVLD